MGLYISHSHLNLTVKSHQMHYEPVSILCAEGPGTPFGETQGYEGNTGCTLAGDCYPYSMNYFSFNFDLNIDGDDDIDTPPEHYLRFACEISNTPTTPRDVEAPDQKAEQLCRSVLEQATQLRFELSIPACVGKVCPYSACEGSLRRYDGSCDPVSGQCTFASAEECGALGCNVGTGHCNVPESEACQGVVCEPAMCREGQSYYDPLCNPDTSACEYVVEGCGSLGCNPESGRCNQPVCGSEACEAAQCIENQSFYDPECVNGECQYAFEDCGAAGQQILVAAMKPCGICGGNGPRRTGFVFRSTYPAPWQLITCFLSTQSHPPGDLMKNNLKPEQIAFSIAHFLMLPLDVNGHVLME
jgi:hypothetical protein